MVRTVRKMPIWLVAFLALWLLLCPAALSQDTPPPTRGTIQFKRGPLSGMPQLLMRGQPFADETNYDLYIGFVDGNKRINQRWIFAAGTPSSILGGVGDCYLNTATNDVYQKAASGWVWKANFTGAQGIPGTSVVGPKGDTGATPTFTVGTVTAIPAGGAPTVTLTGTATAKTISFGLVSGANGNNGSNGADGVSPTLSLGTLTPLFSSAIPTASMGGTATARTLSLGLPAAPFVFMADVPAFATLEINTTKSVSFAFPSALPSTNYAYFVQIMGNTGIVNTISWTEAAKTTTGLTLNMKSNLAILAGTTRVWVMVAPKNTQ